MESAHGGPGPSPMASPMARTRHQAFKFVLALFRRGRFRAPLHGPTAALASTEAFWTALGRPLMEPLAPLPGLERLMIGSGGAESAGRGDEDEVAICDAAARWLEEFGDPKRACDQDPEAGDPEAGCELGQSVSVGAGAGHGLELGLRACALEVMATDRLLSVQHRRLNSLSTVAKPKSHALVKAWLKRAASEKRWECWPKELVADPKLKAIRFGLDPIEVGARSTPLEEILLAPPRSLFFSFSFSESARPRLFFFPRQVSLLESLAHRLGYDLSALATPIAKRWMGEDYVYSAKELENALPCSPSDDELRLVCLLRRVSLCWAVADAQVDAMRCLGLFVETDLALAAPTRQLAGAPNKLKLLRSMSPARVCSPKTPSSSASPSSLLSPAIKSSWASPSSASSASSPVAGSPRSPTGLSPSSAGGPGSSAASRFGGDNRSWGMAKALCSVLENLPSVASLRGAAPWQGRSTGAREAVQRVALNSLQVTHRRAGVP